MPMASDTSRWLFKDSQHFCFDCLSFGRSFNTYLWMCCIAKSRFEFVIRYHSLCSAGVTGVCDLTSSLAVFSDQGLCLLRAELSSLQATSPCVSTTVTVTFREVTCPVLLCSLYGSWSQSWRSLRCFLLPLVLAALSWVPHD